MTNVKNIKKLSELELKRNLKTSWHDQYKDSAWIFVGGLPYDLTEGDVISVFSQYGEVVNLNLVRDKATGKSKGFCFLCYEDQRSTVLAVDNLNGIKLLSRTIRVDHVADYKPPKDSDKLDEETQKLHAEGCAPLQSGLPIKREEEKKNKSKSKAKKEKKRKRKKKKKKQVSSSEESSTDNSNSDSGSESDANSEDSVASARNKKHKHSSKKGAKKRKKKLKVTSDSDTSVENETIRESREKRRKLVEKIKTLEAALNYTRKAAKKSSVSEESSSKSRPQDLVEKAHDEHHSRKIEKNSDGHKSEKNFSSERGDKEKNHYQENGTLDKKSNYDSMSRRQERVGGEVAERDDRRWKRSDDTSASRDRDRFRPQERSRDRDRDWDHNRVRPRDRERFTRDRDRDNRWDRGQDRYRR